MKTVFLSLIFMFHSFVSYGANTVLHYSPEVIEVTGIIEQQTFPGPPNYSSIANGDEIEKGWYLRLSEQVDVVETKNDDAFASAETERNVRIMQLTWHMSSEFKEKVRNAVKIKRKVRLKGHLFHRLTGHHHSRVLMWVDQLEEIKP